MLKPDDQLQLFYLNSYDRAINQTFRHYIVEIFSAKSDSKHLTKIKLSHRYNLELKNWRLSKNYMYKYSTEIRNQIYNNKLLAFFMYVPTSVVAKNVQF